VIPALPGPPAISDQEAQQPSAGRDPAREPRRGAADHEADRLRRDRPPTGVRPAPVPCLRRYAFTTSLSRVDTTATLPAPL